MQGDPVCPLKGTPRLMKHALPDLVLRRTSNKIQRNCLYHFKDLNWEKLGSLTDQQGPRPDAWRPLQMEAGAGSCLHLHVHPWNLGFTSQQTQLGKTQLKFATTTHSTSPTLTGGQGKVHRRPRTPFSVRPSQLTIMYGQKDYTAQKVRPGLGSKSQSHLRILSLTEPSF